MSSCRRTLNIRMRGKMRVKYIANDGAEFGDADLCRAYEKLIEASKDECFHSAVENLFDGCKSYESGSYLDDPTYTVMRLDDSGTMDVFKANLVRALPELTQLLNSAMERFD